MSTAKTPVPWLPESKMFEYAMWLAKHGLSVIPLCWTVWDKERQSWVCGCGECENLQEAGKRPLVAEERWVHRASHTQIKKWWTRWPQANIGVLIEPPNWLVVELSCERGACEVLNLDSFRQEVREGSMDYKRQSFELESEQRGVSDDELKVGLLQLSRQRYEVFYGEDKLFLSPSEFSLLELLMLHVGDLVSYQMMFTAMSPGNSEYEPSNMRDIVRQRLHHLKCKVRLVCGNDLSAAPLKRRII